MALVVLTSEPIEHRRPQIASALPFAAAPRGGAQVIRRLLAGDVAHLLDAGDAGQVVVTGLEIPHRGQERDGSGSARRLVTARRHAGEGRMQTGEEAAEVPLAGEELAGEVPDVGDLHRLRRHPGVLERAADGGPEHLEEPLAGAAVVVGEVGLVTAEDEDRPAHAPLSSASAPIQQA